MADDSGVPADARLTQSTKKPAAGGTEETAPSIVAAVALVAGCESIGPEKLVGTHQGYNDAVQLAESREMLLNIVRLRFGE